MSEPVLIAVIAVLGTLGTGVLAWLTASQARTWKRIENAEASAAQAESTNHALWLYTRTLIHHIYAGRGAPPPDPPDYVKHLYGSGNTT